MSSVDFVFRIGGEAGQGVESSGAGFATALTRAGLNVVAVPDYYSRIRGGHNFFSVRASETAIHGPIERVDILIALTDETVDRHLEHMSAKGIIILDANSEIDDETVPGPLTLLRAPLMDIAEKHGTAVMANTAALAVAAGLVRFDVSYLEQVVRDNFGKKGQAVVDANLNVLLETYQWTLTQTAFARTLDPQQATPRIACTGNQAFAMGALTAGCKFVAAYPMTPATTVFEYMCKHAAEWGVVTKHAESEIAAINMCVGAAHSGVRVMVPTSGGGFDLMTEGLSLAGMTETPLVIYLAQRPGPATGLATRTGQADLNLAMYAGHGEFPRVVMAPGTPAQAFECAQRAFNIAEKYQCQVLVLSDEYLASSIFSQNRTDFDTSPRIDRGKLLSGADVDALDEYNRYELTDDGVSPRAIVGSSPKAVYLTTGNEHQPDGHITEDAATAEAMALKRNRKLDSVSDELNAPTVYGDTNAALTLVGWGSTYGALVETVDALNTSGKSARMVHFCDISPLPTKSARKILGDRPVIMVEGNVQGQMEALLQQKLSLSVRGRIHRIDGRPFTRDYIMRELEA